MNTTEFAQDLLSHGLSVIPIALENKKPTVPWTAYQKRLPVIGEEITFAGGRTTTLTYNGAIALIGGPVSGNVECIDFDCKHDPTIYDRFVAECGEFWPEIAPQLVIQRTRSGGYHIVYKCETIEGNRKLANKATTTPGVSESLIETRGRGGYFVIAPTPGYTLLQGDWRQIPTITPQDRQRLFDYAILLNEVFVNTAPPPAAVRRLGDDSTRPGDRFNQEGSIHDILMRHNWTLVRQRTDQVFYRRPGDTDSMWSGSFKPSINTFYVYTTSVAGLTAGHAYTPFTLLTALEHNGDYAACAQALYALQHPSHSPARRPPGEPPAITEEAPAEPAGSPKRLTRIEKIENWLRENYEFRRNVITDMISCRDLSLGVWVPCKEANIWRDIQHHLYDIGTTATGNPISVPISDVNQIIDSDFVPDYNPFHEYFNSLPPWDGKDHITDLAGYVQTDAQDFWVDQFKKALVRSLACTLGGVVNRMVIVLVGEAQETGKTSIIRFLCPPQLQAYYKEDPMVHDKDSDIALAENFIWNLEELDDLNKKEISEMKATISKRSIKQRRAYDRREKHMTRIVNFWGSTNKSEFLSDTQNTRWLCFNVLSVDHSYSNYKTGEQKIDIDKVWAQAYHLYKAKYIYDLSPEDRQTRDTRNETFQSMTIELQAVLQFFKKATETTPGAKFMAAREITTHILQNNNARLKINEINVGRAMRQAGFTPIARKINNKVLRGYWVVATSTPNDYDDGTPAPQPSPPQQPPPAPTPEFEFNDTPF